MSSAFWGAAIPGITRGAQTALGGYASMGAGTPAAAGAAEPTWIDKVLAQAKSRPPEMEAQAPDISELLSPREQQIPLRLPQGTETQERGRMASLREMFFGDTPEARQRREALGQVLGGIPGNAVLGQSWVSPTQRSAILSARNSKKDVARDKRSLREILKTPSVTYRYKDEPGSAPKRPGIIAEQAPASWRTGPGGHLIKSPAWMGAQHGAIQNLARRVEKLEK